MKEMRNIFSNRAARRSMTLETPGFWPNDTDFELLASRILRKFFLSHQVCGDLLQ
jgi:hypothetical protein